MSAPFFTICSGLAMWARCWESWGNIDFTFPTKEFSSTGQLKFQISCLLQTNLIYLARNWENKHSSVWYFCIEQERVGLPPKCGVRKLAACPSFSIFIFTKMAKTPWILVVSPVLHFLSYHLAKDMPFVHRIIFRSASTSSTTSSVPPALKSDHLSLAIYTF